MPHNLDAHFYSVKSQKLTECAWKMSRAPTLPANGQGLLEGTKEQFSLRSARDYLPERLLPIRSFEHALTNVNS